MKARREDLHALSGCYVVDALSPAERADFEHHLRHCATCEDEVRGLSETATRLAMAATLEPPPAMEQRVLAATYRTRQLPPPLASHRRSSERRSRVSRWFPGQAPSGGGRRPALMPRLAIGVATVAVAVAGALGITEATTQHQLNNARASGTAITRVVTAPDARTERMPATGGGTVTVVVSAKYRAAVVTSRGMPSLSGARVYQVWVINSAGARSAGLLGRGNSLLAGSVASGDKIGITVEPAGGTKQPTTTPLVLMPVTT